MYCYIGLENVAHVHDLQTVFEKPTHTNRLFSWRYSYRLRRVRNKVNASMRMSGYLWNFSQVSDLFIWSEPMQNMSASLHIVRKSFPPAWVSTNNWDVWLWPNQTFWLLMACSSNNLITYLSSQQHDMPLFPLLGDEIDRQMHHIKACNLPSKLPNTHIKQDNSVLSISHIIYT